MNRLKDYLEVLNDVAAVFSLSVAAVVVAVGIAVLLRGVA